MKGSMARPVTEFYQGWVGLYAAHHLPGIAVVNEIEGMILEAFQVIIELQPMLAYCQNILGAGLL